MLTGKILIDLQKAFGTTNHEIVLKNLEPTGFSDQCVLWFLLYLCEQIFFIKIEKQLSDYRKILCGVPQGSVLGLLLFLVYVNDMPQAVKSSLFSICQ